jgi:hypothetical protein
VGQRRAKRWALPAGIFPRRNGKVNEMPSHHKLEEYLDAYIKSASVVRSSGARI